MTVRSRPLAFALLLASLTGWAGIITTDLNQWLNDHPVAGHPLHKIAINILLILSFLVIVLYATNPIREGQARINRRLDALHEEFAALLAGQDLGESEVEEPTSDLRRRPFPKIPQQQTRAIGSASVPPPPGTVVNTTREPSAARARRRSNGPRRRGTRKGNPSGQGDVTDRGEFDPGFSWQAYLAGRADAAADGDVPGE